MVTQNMKQHVTVVGALHIGLGALGLLIACVVFVAVAGGGLLSGNEDAIAITSVVGSVVAGFVVIVSLPGIIAGVGVIMLKPWARILMLVVAVFDLLNIPIGTALGIYTVWVLIQDQTIELFSPSA